MKKKLTLQFLLSIIVFSLPILALLSRPTPSYALNCSATVITCEGFYDCLKCDDQTIIWACKVSPDYPSAPRGVCQPITEPGELFEKEKTPPPEEVKPSPPSLSLACQASWKISAQGVIKAKVTKATKGSNYVFRIVDPVSKTLIQETDLVTAYAETLELALPLRDKNNNLLNGNYTFIVVQDGIFTCLNQTVTILDGTIEEEPTPPSEEETTDKTHGWCQLDSQGNIQEPHHCEPGSYPTKVSYPTGDICLCLTKESEERIREVAPERIGEEAIPLEPFRPQRCGGSKLGLSYEGIFTALGCIPTQPQALVAIFLNWFIGLAGGVAFILMLFAAFQILTSAGNPERIQAGQEMLTSAIIGLLFIIFSVFLLKIVGIPIMEISQSQ